MFRKAFLAGLFLAASTAVAAAQTITAWVGTVVADSVSSQCGNAGGPNMFGEPGEIFSLIFVPGHLNTGSGLTTTFSVRNQYFTFAANVPVDPVANPTGELIAGASYDVAGLDPLGNILRRKGRIISASFIPANYAASSRHVTITVRLSNVNAIAGCAVTFRGVGSKINN